MANEYESMARILMASPQGAKIIGGLDRLNSAASSPSGRQLLQMLGSGGTDILKVAAQQAGNASHDAGRVLLSTLLSTKEGTALVGKFIEALGI